MNNGQTSPKTTDRLTQHAMLVVWGVYAQRLGLVKALEQVKLHQKKREHRPQTKVLEFLVAILAGLPHLQDISKSAHPLDKDVATAEAWGQPVWADYSGVSRTVQSLYEAEVETIRQAVDGISQPIIDQETELALDQSGQLIYDADLTGRPVSNSSTSYPGAAYGYMGDTVSLGYQAALVSVHSPTYGRLWLVNRLHPGDTVSSTQAQALVQAAEERTGRRPRRRTELVTERLAQAETGLKEADACFTESDFLWMDAQANLRDTTIDLADWRQSVRQLETEYQREGRQPSAHCKLSRARRKVATYEKRLPRVEAQQARAQRRLQRHGRVADEWQTQVERLRNHLADLAEENRTNPTPIQAVFRLDSGFASQDNIDWLIEMGYDIYTKSRSTKVRQQLSEAVTPKTDWQQVGGNATLTAWPSTTVEGLLTYPMDVALAHYQTGEKQRRSVLLHYGATDVTQERKGWFHMYNGRQSIEAGIKEGKGVFQMHHLKVRSPQGLVLQEIFATFAANFVRFAAHWLSQQPGCSPAVETKSVKQMVQVSAHTSAWVQSEGDVWLLRFTEQSLYAGHSLYLGDGPVQLPLPIRTHCPQHSFLSFLSPDGL